MREARRAVVSVKLCDKNPPIAFFSSLKGHKGSAGPETDKMLCAGSPTQKKHFLNPVTF